MTQHRELELIVDARWGTEHPGQATAICMARVRCKLGLDSQRGQRVLHHRKLMADEQAYSAPLLDDGTPMVLAKELAPRLGVGRRCISNWIQKGYVKTVTQQEGSYRRRYVSEAEVRHYLATRKETRGRKRKER